MKYRFTFTEINSGSIEIKAATTPTRAEVINAIENGNAYIKGTEYKNIRLEENEHQITKKSLDRER